MLINEDEVDRALGLCKAAEWGQKRRVPHLPFRIHIALNSLLSRDIDLFSKDTADIVETLRAAPSWVQRVIEGTDVEAVGFAIYLATVYKPPISRLH